MSEVGEKRRSRFDRVDSEPESKKVAIDVSAVAARAAEMSRELSSKVPLVFLLIANIYSYFGFILNLLHFVTLDCNGDLAIEQRQRLQFVERNYQQC